MMEGDDEDEILREAYTEDAFGGRPHGTATVPPPRKTEFFPWHRVRKQYVRRHQWIAETERLSSDLQKRQIRLLTLPGPDFLDVRALAKRLRQQSIELLYCGFIDAQTESLIEEVNLSHSELRGHAHVNKDSGVVLSRFQDIATDKSIGYRTVKRSAPFDVVNLDLCSSAFDRAPGQQDSILTALANLVALQDRNKHPWILFLTSTVGRKAMHPQVKEAFLELILRNYNEEGAFSQRSDELGASRDILMAESEGAEALSHETLARLTGLALGKWLAQLCLHDNPPWRVKLLRSYWYSHGPLAPGIASWGFRFSPLDSRRTDPIGLASIPSADRPREIDLAMQMLNRIADIRDVDVLLREHASLFAELLNESIDLMTSARYDGEAYRAWASDMES